MAEKLMNFFKKKKIDTKFKLAGPGHKLSENSMSSGSSATPSVIMPPRSGLTTESKVAAEAALARLQQTRTNPSFNTSLASIKAQVKKDLENEVAALSSKPKTASCHEKMPEELELPKNMAAAGVFFKCPLIGDEILARDEWKKNIKKFLYEQLEEERGLTACLIIQSCNGNREKIEACVETLCKYLENIMKDPTEEKYRKIRMTNRVFIDKVQSIEGAVDLLLAAGFEQKKVTNSEGVEEDYLVFGGDGDVCIERLETLVDALRTAEPIQLELDRNLQVLLPSQAAVEIFDTLDESLARFTAPSIEKRTLVDALRTAEPIQLELDRNLQVLLPSQAAGRMQLPPAFYALTPEELKKEHQLRAEAIEKSQMLRTKAMREKDELREMRKYKYAIIRIRFPDGILLQGTFSVYEKYIDIHSFVQQNLEHSELPFILNMPTGQKLNLEEDANKNLIDLRLVPATVLIFAWHPNVASEISNSPNRDVYLKPEVMILVKEM